MDASKAAPKTALGCALLGLAAVAAAQPADEERPPSTPPWQAASPWPDRIVVTLEADPATSFSVSWRTDADVDGARAEVRPAADHARIDLAGTETAEARTRRPDVTRKRVDGESYRLRWNDHVEQPAYHSVTFDGLEPDTLYAYRVMGAEGHWSEWFQTRTAPEEGVPFRFLYFGDAQDGILSHWARVVRAAFAAAPDARFAVHAGDLVNIASRDFEWAEWFEAVGFIHGMIPALPLAGNHEYFDAISGDDGAVSALSVLWRPQFALPVEAELPEALHETVYTVRYGDVRIAALDSMGGHFDAQAEWLDGVLEASEATWNIVAMHHPMFELVERSYPDGAPQRRDAFLPVLRRHGVDLVLQGHDHSYGRGSALGSPRAPGAGRREGLGTVFVTSAAGAKMYEVAGDRWERFAEHGARLERAAENTPFFQVISVDGDALSYEARTATGRVYDAFRLRKQQGGPNRLEELPTDFDEERRFDNTGPYERGRLDTVPPAP